MLVIKETKNLTEAPDNNCNLVLKEGDDSAHDDEEVRIDEAFSFAVPCLEICDRFNLRRNSRLWLLELSLVCI